MKRFFSTNSVSLIFSLSAAVIACAAFVIHSKTAPQLKSARAAQNVQNNLTRAADSFPAVPPSLWVNKKFVVLKKPPLFRKFGYELYLTKELSAHTAAIDTSIETDKHHARYALAAGKILRVTDVEPRDGEYLVSFFEEGGGHMQYFGKTRKGAIEGIASADELNLASRKWVGKTVYSRRRFIDTYDSVAGAYGTIKVRIQDKLKVTGVSWGLTPLPPKTVWLEIETPAGEKGFIPICMSWTNVMADKTLPGPPWQEELLEKDPTEVYKWDSLTWNAVNSHTVVSGMTKEQVVVSWGRPHKVTADTSRLACPEQWLYGSQYLCFSRDSVIAIGAR
jgi:hypothetical protein